MIGNQEGLIKFSNKVRGEITNFSENILFWKFLELGQTRPKKIWVESHSYMNSGREL